jgi:4-diphosphocytidyl-2-C-methyl-D-erythritol kinase
MPNLPPPPRPGADQLVEYAPAKLNLYLHVLGRDHRTYHLLDSLVAFADAADIVRASTANRFSLRIEGPYGAGLEADERNLVWRAAMALGELAGRRPDYAVTLTKNLPVASGIGGGSSDAAAMLRLLCREWGLNPLAPEIKGLAKSLGEDVPVCLAARSTYMGGTGEILEPCPLPLPDVPIVLINPGVAVPTKDVFAHRRGSFSMAARLRGWPTNVEELADELRPLANDLAASAIELAPAIGTVLGRLETAADCLLARMLGSGATCYGLFATHASALRFAERARSAHPGWWVHAGRLIDSLDDLTPSAA